MSSTDDERVVRTVLNNRSNYYAVLGVERTVTTESLKLAYKRMALRCHPDKNKHPKAGEAFQLVGLAHSTLTDPAKRRVYDRGGAEGVRRHESNAGRRAAPAAHPAFRRRAGEMPQSPFGEFFFGGGPGGAHVHASQFDINPQLLLLIPLLLFIFVSMLLQSSMTDISEVPGRPAGGSRYGSSSRFASFSLSPSQEDGHVVERTTSHPAARVRYYVTRAWNEQAERGRADLRSMEAAVLQRQTEYLNRRCEADSLKYRARRKTEQPETCGEYQRLRTALRNSRR